MPRLCGRTPSPPDGMVLIRSSFGEEDLHVFMTHRGGGDDHDGCLNALSNPSIPQNNHLHSRALTPETFPLIFYRTMAAPLIIILSALATAISCTSHLSFNQTWSVTSYNDGKTLYTISTITPLGTFFPTLSFNLTDVMELGLARYPPTQGRVDFYVCPSTRGDRTMARTCRGTEQYFCASWGCETQIPWSPWTTKPNALISITRDPKTRNNCLVFYYPSGGPYSALSGPSKTPKQPCNALLITFTTKGKTYQSWTSGVNFGIRQYLSGTDYGGIFNIKLQAIPTTSPVRVGPNLALPSRPKHNPPPKQKPTITHPHPTPTTLTPVPSPTKPAFPSTKDSIVALLSATFHTLNSSNPNLTQSCWLCLSAIPPFYKGIATPGKYSIARNHTQCRWQHHRNIKLTRQSISGTGLCVGRVPSSHRH